LQELFRRANLPTTILTITDLSREGFCWSQNLAAAIAEARSTNTAEIAVLHAALMPQQVIDLKMPMVSQKKGTSAEQKEYKKYLKPHGLNDHKIAELDALEVYYPGGLAAFADHILTTHHSRVTALDL
jgi:hypothetical protein